MTDQPMTTAGLQAKVSLRRAWFESHLNQPIPEGRAEVEALFAAIEREATPESVLLESKPIRYHIKGRISPVDRSGPQYDVDLTVEAIP